MKFEMRLYIIFFFRTFSVMYQIIEIHRVKLVNKLLILVQLIEIPYFKLEKNAQNLES